MIAAAILLQAAVIQQPQRGTPDTSPTVVVTGRRADHDKAVRHMTARAAPVGDASQPLPRFAAPICPEAAGLPAAVAARFAERMRQGARDGGIAVDRPCCSPNITVMFVPNGQEVVRALHKSRPAMFGTLEPFEVRRLESDGGPVHVWSFTELRSRDDDRPRVGTTTGRDVPELQVRNASIVEATTRIVVDGVIMLIDQQAAVGKTIDQLADYAVMRAVAQARPVGDAAAEPTILRLFDAGEPPPRGLTPFDTAYLSAFYKGAPTALPLSKIGLMARSINKSLVTTVTTPAASPTP